MLNYSYCPFLVSLDDLKGEDLLNLKNVSEGWYVDYKEQGLKIADFAKHLSAFANQYGGWLFIGIKENPDGSRSAMEFCGIPKSEIEKVSRDIREASAAHANPEVLYEEKVINGPVDKIGLPEGRSILIVGIPMSYNTPHIHSSGRVYRRLADQSKPKEETDRFILDELWKRGDLHQRKITAFLKTIPVLPDSQSDSPWVHVYFRPAQHQVGPSGRLSFDNFSKIVRNHDDSIWGVQSPMQAINTTADGYLARQILGKDPSLATLTLRWWHDGTVRFDVPLNRYSLSKFSEIHENYRYAGEYCELAHQIGYSSMNIVDYSICVPAIASLTNYYLHMLKTIGDERDTYSCFTLRNVFHTSPFVDSKLFIEKARLCSIPLTIDQIIAVPMEPSEANMVPHTHSIKKDIDFKSCKDYQSLPYLYSCPVFYKVLEAIGVISNFEDFMADQEAWGFDKIGDKVVPQSVYPNQ